MLTFQLLTESYQFYLDMFTRSGMYTSNIGDHLTVTVHTA